LELDRSLLNSDLPESVNQSLKRFQLCQEEQENLMNYLARHAGPISVPINIIPIIEAKQDNDDEQLKTFRKSVKTDGIESSATDSQIII